VLITRSFDSRVPTRYFLGKPRLDDEIQISIEEGKMLIIKLLAIGTLDEKRGTREVFFEMNGEVRASQIEDRSAAVEHVSREKATKEPGSVGSPLSGVVVEVRVHEGSAVKAGDPLVVMSASESSPQDCDARQGDGVLTNPVLAVKMESMVSAPVSGKVKRVLVAAGDSISQNDLVVEIGH
jgi:pyruvate carboxylase